MTSPIDYTLRKSKSFFNPNRVIREKDAGRPVEKRAKRDCKTNISEKKSPNSAHGRSIKTRLDLTSRYTDPIVHYR